MVAQLTCRFPSKHNGNGSHDSICISCFASVASVRNEAELAQREQDHICDSSSQSRQLMLPPAERPLHSGEGAIKPRTNCPTSKEMKYVTGAAR